MASVGRDLRARIHLGPIRAQLYRSGVKRRLSSRLGGLFAAHRTSPSASSGQGLSAGAGPDTAVPDDEQRSFGVAQSANDMKAHEQTYGGFIGLLKWSVPILALLTLLIIVVIS